MKAITPICGRPMICHLFDRMKQAARIDEIILCTSPLAQDDPLAELARSENINCFRGDPVDVFQRLTDAAKQFHAETVINVMADNPFTDPVYIDRLVDFHLQNKHDYSKTEGLPLGAYSYALAYPAMVKVCELKADSDTEIWGGYFSETNLFRWGVMKVEDPEVNWPELRLTVDTPEDFQMATRIFKELYQPGQIFSLKEVIALCRRKPELPAINAAIQQRQREPVTLKGKQG